MKTIHKILLCVVTASGGCATGDGSTPSIEGKAPTLAAIRGDEIPSELVDPDRYYATSKLIDSIDVTKLTPELRDLATRIDGLPNGIPNHAIEVDELVALEGSHRWRTLSPDEQAAVPALWRFLEVEIDGSFTH